MVGSICKTWTYLMIKVGDRVRYKEPFYQKINMTYPPFHQVNGLVIHIEGANIWYIDEQGYDSYGYDYEENLEVIND
jgi:hypothetical protein